MKASKTLLQLVLRHSSYLVVVHTTENDKSLLHTNSIGLRSDGTNSCSLRFLVSAKRQLKSKKELSGNTSPWYVDANSCTGDAHHVTPHEGSISGDLLGSRFVDQGSRYSFIRCNCIT